jgi:hypothetical protein
MSDPLRRLYHACRLSTSPLSDCGCRGSGSSVLRCIIPETAAVVLVSIPERRHIASAVGGML